MVHLPSAGIFSQRHLLIDHPPYHNTPLLQDQMRIPGLDRIPGVNPSGQIPPLIHEPHLTRSPMSDARYRQRGRCQKILMGFRIKRLLPALFLETVISDMCQQTNDHDRRINT